MVDSSKRGETETILNPEDNFEDLFLTQSHEKGKACEDKFIEKVSNFQRIQYSVRDHFRELDFVTKGDARMRNLKFLRIPSRFLAFSITRCSEQNGGIDHHF